MGDEGTETGFDDQFDDGLFQTAVHNGRRERPDMWPKSVSEMRTSTTFTDHGMGMHVPETAASRQALSRAPARGRDMGRERMPALRQYFDSARNRWVWIDRDGRIVATK
jgi:hypothetical protein